MVGPLWPGALGASAQLWASALPLGEALSPWERLDPQRKLLVLMALAVILFLGLMLMILVWVGGRWVRRLARERRARHGSSMIGPSDWEPQPYVAGRDDVRRGGQDSDSDEFDDPDSDDEDADEDGRWRP